MTPPAGRAESPEAAGEGVCVCACVRVLGACRRMGWLAKEMAIHWCSWALGEGSTDSLP